MSAAGIVLVAAGAVIALVGLGRARRPWASYRALRAQEDNIARYEAWRGGLRDTGPTGASVAMAMLRRELQVDGGLIAIGLVGLLVGLFAVR